MKFGLGYVISLLNDVSDAVVFSVTKLEVQIFPDGSFVWKLNRYVVLGRAPITVRTRTMVYPSCVTTGTGVRKYWVPVVGAWALGRTPAENIGSTMAIIRNKA